MKIAICISGMPRHIFECYKGILNLFPGHEVDIFFHLWNPGTPDGRDKNHVSKENILKFFNPKQYLFEEMQHFENNNQCMIYSLYKANELKKEYELKYGIYDYVLRTRPDMIYVSDINKLLSIKDNHIITSYLGTCGILNDMLALSNSKTMDIYCEWFHHMKNPDLQCDSGGTQCIHEMLVKYLKFRNISAATEPFYCTLYREKLVKNLRINNNKVIESFKKLKNLPEDQYKNEKWLRMLLTNCEVISPDKYNLRIII